MKRQLLTLMLLTSVLNAREFAEISSRNVPVEDLQQVHQNRMEEQENLLGLVPEDDEIHDSLLNKKGSLYIVNNYYDASEHIATFFSPDGRIVELEDETQWLIYISDVAKAAKWLTSDPISIYPNKDFFKSTGYKLTNLALNETVCVDLIRGPNIYSLYAKFVSAIDLYTDAIYLTDGSRWDIAWTDSALTRHWMPNDVVIVGENYGWFSSSYPYILINVSLNEYVTCYRGY